MLATQLIVGKRCYSIAHKLTATYVGIFHAIGPENNIPHFQFENVATGKMLLLDIEQMVEEEEVRLLVNSIAGWLSMYSTAIVGNDHGFVTSSFDDDAMRLFESLMARTQKILLLGGK